MKKKIKWFIILILLVVIIVWTIYQNNTVGVTHYEVSSDNLPDSFDNYRIALITDLHNAVFGEDNKDLLSAIQKESPDIIAITGDLVDSNHTDIAVALDFVRNASQIAPCYYVTGNHEFRLKEQYEQLEAGLIEANVSVLHDDATLLSNGTDSVMLIGLDDPLFTERNVAVYESMFKTKLSAIERNDEYTILLSHRPELFNAYVASQMDLVLSGHAHGGQFRLPFIGGLVAPAQGLFPKYDAGLFTEGHTTMVVGRGLGESIIPFRFNNQPELVIITLKSEQ